MEFDAEKEMMLDAITDHIIFHNRDLSVRWANAEACRSIGMERNEVTGCMCYELWHGRTGPCEGCPVLNALETGIKSENTVQTPDGRCWEVTGEPVLGGNESVAGVVEVARDITERRISEANLKDTKERLQVLVGELPMGVSLVSGEGVYEYINPKFTEIFGYTLREIPTGREWFRKAFPDKNSRNRAVSAWKKDQRALGPGKARLRKFSARRKDGTEKVINFMPVELKNGDQLIIYEDITERQSLEAQFLQAQRMEAVGTLAGGVAHNFNNILLGIQGRVSLLLMEKEASHPDFEHLKGIEDYVKRAAGLTKEILSFSRDGKHGSRPTDLNELIKHENRMFGQTKREISIHGKYEKSLWPADLDEGQIQQAIMNLYLNAWQAMPEGGDLYVQTENIFLEDYHEKPINVAPGRYVKISVTDAGVGMDESTKERVFEPFFTTKEEGEGTGLGLASVYWIIKNHEGFINLYSEKGKGVTFNIYLPASEDKVVKEKRPPLEVVKGEGTILLVDDEEMILDVGERWLKRLGYKVLKAQSGKEAIEVYEKNKARIDLVILDLVMPGMGGGETYDRLKEIDPDVKVLLSSGYSINGQAQKILERGCDGFIQKPFNMRDVSQKIGEMLDLDKE